MDLMDRTRIEAVMAAIRQRIDSRNLAAGDRLPSIRAFAATMKVSTSTVVEAYDRLAADGTIRARPGSGFYVSARLAPRALSDMAPRLDRAIDPFWVSRQSLEAGEGVLLPGCGWLPAAMMPHDLMRKGLRGLSRADDGVLADYATPLGHPGLRVLLSRRLADLGVDAAPDRILLTESGTQAIDLICRILLSPGDAVLVDDPCYFNFLALLKAHRATIIPVPMTRQGPDVAQFAALVDEHRPKLYITNSAIHNPTGARLAPSIAHRILTIAEQSGLMIVEDDIFGDFEHDPAPRLAALDGLARVILIGSFSKSLSASCRLGYAAASPATIEALADIKIATSFSGGRLAAELVASMLTDGSYRRHMEALRNALAHAMREVAARLSDLGIRPWIMPDSGFFLWCSLPEGVDAADLARQGLAEGIVLAPGNVFSVSQQASAQMRFNVAQCGDERLWHFLRKALGNRR